MSADPPPTPAPSLIRGCRPDDLPAIQRILALSPEAAPWSHSALNEILASHRADFLVASHHHEIAGFIIGRQIADEAEILNLAIHPANRRHGLATALVKALLESFSHLAATRVFLEVRESNSPAIVFYQRLGFLQTGCRPAYYSAPIEAALLLSLELRSHP
jgi:ribosomal-protein-alanine N-acetyltransferase